MFEKQKAERAATDHAAAVAQAAAVAHEAHAAWQASKLEQTVPSVSGVMLKKDEVAYGTIIGAGLVEPRRAPGQWSGASHGMSFHVAKGVNYRVGQSRGTYTQGEERPTVIDSGLFVITNQRCLFVGSKRSTEWAYSKLLGFSLEGVGVAIFNVSNRQKASGVSYSPNLETVFDAIVAAAIARFQGEDSHRALVAELEANYAATYNAWNSLQTAGPSALPTPR